MAELIAAIAAVVAVLIAAVALAVALRANELAQEGHGIAETANDTATDALGEAQEANRISKDANDLAGDANEIADRALRVAQDDVPYNWVLKIDDQGAARVVNDCGHRAFEVSIVIDRGGNVVEEIAAGDVEPFAEILFDLQGPLEEHFEQVRANPYEPVGLAGNIVFTGGSGDIVETEFRAHLRWHTEEQVPRFDVVKEVLRHQMTGDGMVRVSDSQMAARKERRRRRG